MRDWIRLLLKCFVWVVLALSLAAPIWFLWQRSHPMNAKPESIGAFRKSDNASSLSAMSNSYRLNSAAGTLSSEQQALQARTPVRARTPLVSVSSQSMTTVPVPIMIISYAPKNQRDPTLNPDEWTNTPGTRVHSSESVLSHLRIQGLIQTRSGIAVIINDKPYRVGSKIGSVKILRITNDNLFLEYQGTQIVKRMPRY